MESTRPDTKHHSQSSELTGSLDASNTAPTHWPDHSKEFYEQELKRYNAGARDFMYEWIRSKSGK